jgi:transcriptional regulator with XRE-family HTH domain
MSLGDFIKAHGFRQDHIAGQLGLTKTQFNRICMGHSPLSVARIYQLAGIMRLPVADVTASVIPEIKDHPYNGTQASDAA